MGDPPRRHTLADFLPGNRTAPPAPQPPADRPRPADPVAGCTITGTKKGGLPVAIEKRAKGKRVTVVQNCSGPGADRLLKALKDCIGAGGALAPGQIEIQGEHLDRVTTFLQSPQPGLFRLVNVQGAKPPARAPVAAAASAARPAEEERGCRVVATPASKEQKAVLLRIQKAMPAAFLEAHNVKGCTGNQLAKIKYAEFGAIWKAFCECAPNPAWKAVTGRS